MRDIWQRHPRATLTIMATVTVALVLELIGVRL